MHKSGFISIIGKPNVGKSSLLNALMGEKLSAVTHKAQTTRHRIFGLLNTEDYQLVISDTPGLIKPAYLMQEGMMKFVQESMKDADVFLLMTDVFDKFDFNEVVEKMRKSKIPMIVAINKSDLSTQEKLLELIEKWQKLLPEAEVMPISALFNFNLDKILNSLLSHIPFHEPYFSKDEISNLPVRFFTSEIIREKIFLNYEKEIPYSVEVVIDGFEEEKDITRIRAIIYVMRDSQKGIIIGKKGEALKRVGTEARKDIEVLIDKHVFLELYVKVLKDWRENKNNLKNFGLMQ
jgi:GTP-binding protein Era